LTEAPANQWARKETAVPAAAEDVVRTFMRNGRVVAMPAKRSRRLILLDYIAQLFELGVRYEEAEVNHMLRKVFEDYAALRRYLVDAEFLDRDHGIYWRTGGTAGG